MRPPKRILLVCADEQLHSRLAFVLESKLYGVLRAHGAAEALAILAREPADSLHVLLAELPLPGLDEVMKLARGCHPEMRILARSNHSVPPADQPCEVWLPHTAGMAELVERIRVLVARKRGPKALRAVLDASRENREVA